MVSQAYPGMSRYVQAFLHLRQPSSLLHLGKSGFGYNDVVVASSNWELYVMGGKISMMGIRLIC